MNKFVRLSTVVILPLLLGGATDQRSRPNMTDPLPLLREPVAEDEIFNEGASSPSVAFSLVQGGLPLGTIDGGNNLDDEAALFDVFGADATIGTSDDDLNLTAPSPAVDAGSNTALPPDRFDLDGDGNTVEPLPMDKAGNKRSFDGGIGSPTADIGAYEFGAPVATGVQEPTAGAFQTYLSDPFPNPATDEFTFRFGTRSSSSVRMMVYDALGREVLVAYEDFVQGGQDYQIQIPTTSLASGVYFVRLRTETTEISRQFVLAR
ncbi:MAG: hypothetical protein BMS9Abin05_1742 [Rhodothermia bacterium]|nr:MAG: hypothetical protein BMS9Abin05_1742 [Rhodothermia bacterium]